MKKFTRILSLSLVAVFLVLTFVACGKGPSSNCKTAVEKLKKNNYDAVLAYDRDDYNDDGIEFTVSGRKGDMTKGNYEMVQILYFKDKKSADAYWNKNEDDITGVSETMKKALGSDYTYGKDGKMIYAGTVNAVKAAK